MRFSDYLITEERQNRTTALETAACIGVITDSGTVAELDQFVKMTARKQKDALCPSILQKIKNSMLSGYDWKPDGVSQINSIDSNDKKYIQDLCKIIVGMHAFISNEVSKVITTPNFIHNSVSNYRAAEAKHFGRAVVNKANTTDCIITNTSPSELIEAVNIKHIKRDKPLDIQINAEDGYCTIPSKGYVFYQVSLKGLASQQGKVPQTALKAFGADVKQTAIKILPPEDQEKMSSLMPPGRGRKKTTLKESLSISSDNVSNSIKSIISPLNTTISSFMRRGLDRSDLKNVLNLYGAEANESISTSGKILKPLEQKTVDTISANPSVIINKINANLKHAAQMSDGTAIEFIKSSDLKPVSKLHSISVMGKSRNVIEICFTLVANLTMSEFIINLAGDEQRTKENVMKILATMVFGDTKLPLWMVKSSTKDEPARYTYKGMVKMYESKEIPPDVDVFGFYAYPEASAGFYYIFKTLMLEDIDGLSKTYIEMRTGTNSSSHLSFVLEGSEKLKGPYDLDVPMKKILLEKK
jgi:hypothetical protein